MADRLGNGLQNRVEQFDSARYLLKGNIHVNVAFLYIYDLFGAAEISAHPINSGERKYYA